MANMMPDANPLSSSGGKQAQPAAVSSMIYSIALDSR